MDSRIKSFLVYAAKCASGTLAVFIISAQIHYADFVWALISVLLVLSPDGKDALQLAITRIKANIAGGIIGMMFLLFAAANMWLLSAALSVTIAVCYLFKLDAGIRSALAATVIIMLHDKGLHIWDTAVERIIAVLAGCILGLIITYLFHFRTNYNKIIDNKHHEA